MLQWASKEERERRKAICEKCNRKDGVRCGVCGCFLIALQKLHRCPIDKF